MARYQDPVQTKVEDAEKARNPRWYIILSTLAALATIVSVVFLVVPSLPIGKTAPTPTVTPRPSPTPVVLTYSAPKPGPGCDTNQEAAWSTFNAQVECRASGLAITVKIDPAAAIRYIGEVHFVWKDHPFPQDYTARVKIAPQATSSGETICGGLDVLASTAGSYILYMCSNGEWDVARFNEKGTFVLITMGFLSKKASYGVEVHVAGQEIISTVDGTVVNRTTREPAYAQTTNLWLVTGQPVQIPAVDRTATALFSDFVYSYASQP